MGKTIMEKIALAVEPRTQLGKKVRDLRKAGLVPAVLYGKDKKPIHLQIGEKAFREVFAKAGRNSIVDIELKDEKPTKVLIQDVQRHPISNTIIHVDFYAIRMDQKITTEIPLKFVGISPAVKELEGNLVKNYDEIEVECLPTNLVSEIEVDISRLKTFEDQIKIKDLNIPEKIKTAADPEEVVALVTPPRSEEELEEMEKEAASDKEKEAVEDIEKKAEEEKLAKETEKEAEKGEEKPAPVGKDVRPEKIVDKK